jgi:hypothetical protein
MNTIRCPEAYVLVLTSWKDLSACENIHNPLWEEYLNFAPEELRSRDRLGLVAREVDKLVMRMPRDLTYYLPSISRL